MTGPIAGGNLTRSESIDLMADLAGMATSGATVSIAARDYGADVPSHDDFLGMTDYEIQREVGRLESELSARANIERTAPAYEAISAATVELAGRAHPVAGMVAGVVVGEATTATREFISEIRTVDVDNHEAAIRDGNAVLETRQETTQGSGFRQGHSVNPLERAADDFDGDDDNDLQPGRTDPETGESRPVTTTSEVGWYGQILERSWDTIREQDRLDDLEDAARVARDQRERDLAEETAQLEAEMMDAAGENEAPNPEIDKPGPKPIILDLDGNGISVAELSHTTQFVDGGDGLKHRTAWAAAGDGVLFFNVSGDGQIKGRECVPIVRTRLQPEIMKLKRWRSAQTNWEERNNAKCSDCLYSPASKQCPRRAKILPHGSSGVFSDFRPSILRARFLY